MSLNFLKIKKSLPLRSIAIGTFLAFAGGLFINSSSNECRVVSMEEKEYEQFETINKKEENSNIKGLEEEKNKEIRSRTLCLYAMCIIVPIIVTGLLYSNPAVVAKVVENESKNDSSSEKDENGTKLENNSSSETKKEEGENNKKSEEKTRKKEEEEEKKKEEINGNVINGNSSSRIASVVAVPTAVGVASGAAVSGINELIDSNNLVNAKVKVNETVDANKVTDGEGTPEKAKNSGNNESNETKNSKNLNEK